MIFINFIARIKYYICLVMSGYFNVGVVVGAYIAQNYKIPDVKNVCSNIIKKIKDFENTGK